MVSRLDLEQLELNLKEIRQSLVEEILALVKVDAPKNKFSVVSGRLGMAEDILAQIEILKTKRAS